MKKLALLGPVAVLGLAIYAVYAAVRAIQEFDEIHPYWESE